MKESGSDFSKCGAPTGGRLDGKLLRSVLGEFATGVAIVTAAAPDGRLCGLTVNSFSSVSLEPPLVLWSLRRESPSLDVFKSSRSLAISILCAKQEETARLFARPTVDRFACVDHFPGDNGAPIINGCIAYLECEPFSVQRAGDHVLFLWRVTSAVSMKGDLPLVFHGGEFRRVAQCRPALVSR
ncbi:MAG: flavin reductase family protein [Gammaproteobacteria bacterium]|nr:flavin reductase family protein [Gammaproteobacteria bacterium]